MPAPSPLLPHRRVLRAAHRNAVVIGRRADVAADALADFVLPAFVDLPWQERIRDGRAGGADQVQDSAPHLAHHLVRRCETPDTDDRLPGQRLDEIDQRLLRTLLAESGRCGLDGPVRRFHVPEVRDLRQKGNDFVRFRRQCFAGYVQERIGTESNPHGARATDSFFHVLEDFPEQAYAVLEASAVRVGAPVALGQQELVRRVTHARVDVDDVESGQPRAPGRVHVPTTQHPDVLRVHGPGCRQAHPAGIGTMRRNARGGHGRHPGEPIARVTAAVPEFDARQCPVPMHGVDHQGMNRYVVVVPQAAVRQGRVVRTGMNGTLAGIDDTPAALGAHFPHRCARVWHGVARAKRVRRLAKTVWRGDGADPNRLEQDVVTRVPAHVMRAPVRDPRSGPPPPRCRWTGAQGPEGSGCLLPRSNIGARSGSRRRRATLPG